MTPESYLNYVTSVALEAAKGYEMTESEAQSFATEFAEDRLASVLDSDSDRDLTLDANDALDGYDEAALVQPADLRDDDGDPIF
jgi:hypothetical protein